MCDKAIKHLIDSFKAVNELKTAQIYANELVAFWL